jgi:anti-sigma regulatory factor (Ser/Thr protein kinase)
MGEWNVTAADVEAVVSELVTNAIQATRLPIHVWMLADEYRRNILILCSDASSQAPVTMAPDDDSENGRGLMIVTALSKEWGWHRGRDGKMLWALCGVT